MTTTKPTARTTKAPAAKDGPGAPGPKPKSIIVEKNLHYTLESGDTLVLSLLLPLDSLMLMTDMQGTELSDVAALKYMLTEIVPDGVREALQALPDGVEAMSALMAYIEALGERLGASVGESGRSSNS